MEGALAPGLWTWVLHAREGEEGTAKVTSSSRKNHSSEGAAVDAEVSTGPHRELTAPSDE